MEERSIRNCATALLQDFDCGEAELNDFLIRYAKQNEAKGISRTFVLLEDDKAMGFYTLASALIQFEHLPDALAKRLPHYPDPAIWIARLAVAKDEQGNGYGAALLKLALRRILLIAVNAGVAFVLVDAKPNAAGFYERFGFVRLSAKENLYALPIATILKILVK